MIRLTQMLTMNRTVQHTNTG